MGASVSKIKSYTIEMRPFGYGTDCYEVSVVVNGKRRSIVRSVVDTAPHEAEMYVLHRMGEEIIRGLREEEKHSGCCDCCQKKSKCCANTCHV